MADVVVDPDVPEDDAQLITESEHLLIRMRRGWAPDPLPSRASGKTGRVAIAAITLMVLSLLLSGTHVFRGGGLLLVGLIAIPVLLVVFLRKDLDEDEETAVDRETYEQLRWYEGRYVLAADLDESSRRLLARARRAVATVTHSAVNVEGLLDDVRNAVMLPAQEWEIARLLAKLSALRTKHRETMSEVNSPEVAAVAEPLARALDSSEEAVVARVEALERYAANVADAERAYRAHHQIEELRGRIHQYEELVSESGADGFAVPEITRLAEDADQLERALRRSVRSAHEAFRYLDP
ncbi:hypothetical protein ACIBO2_30825 [Nonomuraea sp. NPDC050022]|uniref:hypothetical protein n=1 Tax=unclassified Nonomuraea TaxID=2593643 RepID=UPI0033CC16E9